MKIWSFLRGTVPFLKIRTESNSVECQEWKLRFTLIAFILTQKILCLWKNVNQKILKFAPELFKSNPQAAQFSPNFSHDILSGLVRVQLKICGYFWRTLIFWSRISHSKKNLLFHFWFFLFSWRQRESRESRIRAWLFQTRESRISDLTFSCTSFTYNKMFTFTSIT